MHVHRCMCIGTCAYVHGVIAARVRARAIGCMCIGTCAHVHDVTYLESLQGIGVLLGVQAVLLDVPSAGANIVPARGA